MWTADLCQADSDGDGTSNGAELGDPNCTWTVGGTPEGKSTGHPGKVAISVDPKNLQSQLSTQ
jgi:dopamine beta-monooxygenase